MNNYVTPETAKKLKRLGFPQPVPEPGQVWCSVNNTSFIISYMDEDNLFAISWIKAGSHSYVKTSDLPSCAFAPTDPDILQELGNGYVLTNHLKQWLCCEIENHGEAGLMKLPMKGFHKNNPAEACAESWFEK